jgi:hypothetical protein
LSDYPSSGCGFPFLFPDNEAYRSDSNLEKYLRTLWRSEDGKGKEWKGWFPDLGKSDQRGGRYDERRTPISRGDKIIQVTGALKSREVIIP